MTGQVVPFAAQVYRTVWLSDVHLGSRGCKAAYLADFLRRTHADQLYLVGDIVDLWCLGRRWHWGDDQTEVVRRIS
ncbi:MAG: hypothetical protein IH608_00660 [Proteobacteria bacterium]|nr:hypothetical protein [Pseudomonadota bacterium]